ncbi:MAG: CRISPR-associated endonuclease Cas6, partial [bacterium]
IAAQFPKYELIHNHLNDGKFRYKYPLIQFKTLNRIPTIIGISDGIDILKEVFLDVEHIDIAGRRQKVWEKTILIREDTLGQTDDFIQYRFTNSWMALKEENYATYNTLDPADQQQFLRHLLRENLKTLSKGAGYWIPDIEKVKVEGFFKRLERNFKNNRMICFTGEFMVNFHIPDNLGIGKQVARGFGTVERVK